MITPMHTVLRQAFVTLFVVFSAAVGSGQDHEQHGAPPAPELTKQHKEMAKEAGVWTGEMKMWTSPDAEPMTMPVTETNTVIHNGLWLQSEFESGPYQGRGIYGYDAIKKKLVGTWVDNMSTHLSVMHGEKNEKGELVFHSTGYNPQTQQAEKTKGVSKMISDTEKTFTMYRHADGDWVKQFTVEYKKAS